MHSSVVAQAKQLIQGGRAGEAAELLKKHLQREPKDAAANLECARALLVSGQAKSAEFFAERVVATHPRDVVALSLLGVVRVQAGKFKEAVKPLRLAVEIAPQLAENWNSLGVALAESGGRAESRGAFERSLAIEPSDPRTLLSYGRFLRDCGRVDLAVEQFRKATRLAPGFAGAWTSLAAGINYLNDHDPREVFECHRQLGLAISRGGPSGPRYAQSFEAERPLRVGFVSGDFRTHSVAMFFEPLLEHLDRSRFTPVLYSNTLHADGVTKRFASAAEMVDIRTMSDVDAAGRITEDRIDVLVDLGGWTATSRVEMFRLRAAPVQVTYLGYPATTGLPAMSHRFVDSVTDPLGSEAYCTEALVRLDPCFLCFRPPGELPGVLPRDGAGGVVFCSFNSIMKIGPSVARAWTRILERVAGSRLLLKAIGVGDEYSRNLFLEQFGEAGCDLSRVEVMEYTKTKAEHYGAYARCDVALDPFPYHGTTTTCEALCMGVPVVVLEGRTHVSRVGVSILRAVGLAELVAGSVDEYVEKAAALALDDGRLAELRRTLRERVLGSPLCDEAGFAGRFGEAVRTAWRERCAKKESPYLLG